MDCAVYDAILKNMSTGHIEFNVSCRHAPCLSDAHHQRDGVDAGGEQSRAKGVVSRAGRVRGRQGPDMADARHRRRTELRGEQRGVQRDRLGAVGMHKVNPWGML